jgi:hypothetical protein
VFYRTPVLRHKRASSIVALTQATGKVACPLFSPFSSLEENQPYPRGGLESPLPPEAIEEKFRANAAIAIAREKAEEIVSMVRDLEDLPKIETLADLLAP